MNNLSILFTICGRAGSKGFKNKNLKELEGVPLVYYSLAAIRCFHEQYSRYSVSVALNTDSTALKKLIEDQTIIDHIRLCERKEELSGDLVPKVDVIRDTYLMCSENTSFDAIVDVDITSPFRRAEDIEGVLGILNSNERIEVAFSVVPSRRSPYFNMVEEKHNGLFQRICEKGYTARQQAPLTYEMNASIYAYRPRMLEKKMDGTILDCNCGIYTMPDYLVLDIDSEEDFEMMEYLLPYYARRDESLKKIYECARR